MTELKHTPGPWNHHKCTPNEIPAFEIWTEEKDMLVAYLGHTRTIGQAERNARLIAAAPLLLEHLRDLCNSLDEVEVSELSTSVWADVMSARSLLAEFDNHA